MASLPIGMVVGIKWFLQSPSLQRSNCLFYDYLILVFETEIYSAAQAGLKLVIYPGKN